MVALWQLYWPPRLLQSLAPQQVLLGPAQVPALSPSQVRLPPQSASVLQPVLIGHFLLLLQVSPPQSALVAQVLEQVPVCSPSQVALAFRLVQSPLTQQLLVAGTQLPIEAPLQVPLPQSAVALQVAAEQLPIAPPLHLAPLPLPQSDF